ncbi:MAG TPA: YvcK family protein [Myxococcales bacterium]|nr:YvcK family protein [Myxococcales bacterium]HIM02072.1 YvcK family protein [Myxococcales bacterium]
MEPSGARSAIAPGRGDKIGRICAEIRKILAPDNRRVTADMENSYVVIGGGTGSFSLLSGLRHHPVDLSSIVTMMDSGGNSGVMRDTYGVLPPGDLRRCLIALSDESQMLRDILSYRFEEPPLTGHNLGNLFFLALTLQSGSEKLAIESIGKMLKIKGRVIPVTWDHSHLTAEIEGGEVIQGEGNIDVRGNENPALPPRDLSRLIERVYLAPPASANPDALKAIESAQVVILAPGDLYTSTLPNLLVGGVPEAIQKAEAPFIYVLNLMTKHGETDGYTASRHIEEIKRYAGRTPDAVLIHDGSVPDDLLTRYDDEHAQPVEVDFDKMRALGVSVTWRRDIIAADSLVRHDPTRTAAALVELVDTLLKPDF